MGDEKTTADERPTITPEAIRALESEYHSAKAAAEGFSEALAIQLTSLLGGAGIALGSPIDRRVKSWSSIRENVDRDNIVPSSVLDIHDFSGLRVILLFLRDVKRTCDVIADNFDIKRQYDATQRLEQDQFGYSSVHFVLTLRDEWLKVPTLRHFGGMRAEIQVRTLAQHIWAASSHILQYKHESSVPSDVRRAIHRASALLETVDLEFERVLEQRERYREALVSGERAEPNEPLNVDLVEQILREVFPPENRGENDPLIYAELLMNLQTLGVNTAGALRRLLEQHRGDALAADLETVKRKQTDHAEGRAVTGTSVDRVLRGVYFSHVGLAREALRAAFGNATANAAINIRKGQSKTASMIESNGPGKS